MGRAFILLLAIGGIATAAFAASIEPGLWRTTSVSTLEMPGMPVMPRTQTVEECVTDGSFDPETLFDDQSGCRTENVSESGSVVEFDMVCPMGEGGGEMRGRARYEIGSSSGSGRVDMTVKMNGMSAKMRVEMTSERVGGC